MNSQTHSLTQIGFPSWIFIPRANSPFWALQENGWRAGFPKRADAKLNTFLHSPMQRHILHARPVPAIWFSRLAREIFLNWGLRFWSRWKALHTKDAKYARRILCNPRGFV